MIFGHVQLSTIERAIRQVCKLLDHENLRAVVPWTGLTEDDLWREIVACILGSRVHFHVAHEAIERLDRADLLSERRRSSRYDKYEDDVREALRGSPARQHSLNSKNRYPFSKLRANQIRAAAERFYSQNRPIRALLNDASDAREARRLLVSEVPGLGPKQASLFLRNIGYTAHIAVLDAHVLTYMNWVGLTTAQLISVPSVPQYELLEDAFMQHCRCVGYPPDRFDIAVWVVVRTAKKEYVTCP